MGSRGTTHGKGIKIKCMAEKNVVKCNRRITLAFYIRDAVISLDDNC
jgi:hypothetical protein